MLSCNSLRQIVHTHRASVHQAAKLVAALLRVGRVTVGLVESNGSLPPGLWLTSPAGWLPRTRISSGILCSVIVYWLPLPFYPGGPVPEEIFTHSHPSWSSDIRYQLPPSTTVCSIVIVQFTCLKVLFYNLSSGPLLVFFLVWDPLLYTPCISSPNHHLLFTAHARTIAACSSVIPVLCHLFLISLSAFNLEMSFTLMLHLMTILISACWMLTKVHQKYFHFRSLQPRSHFHATYCFAHNRCTTFLL